MAFLDELRAPLDRWETVSHLRALPLCAGFLIFTAVLAFLVALVQGDPLPFRLNSLARQGYSAAWILNAGLAVWGTAVFLKGLRINGAKRGIEDLGLLLIGGGFFALALWSAAPLEGETPGSSVEAQLHGLYMGLVLIGFFLASGARARSAFPDDVISMAVFASGAVVVCVAMILPALSGLAQWVLLLLICAWCLLRGQAGHNA